MFGSVVRCVELRGGKSTEMEFVCHHNNKNDPSVAHVMFEPTLSSMQVGGIGVNNGIVIGRHTQRKHQQEQQQQQEDLFVESVWW